MEHVTPLPARIRRATGLVAALRTAFALRRHRSRLSDLSDETLRDIGLTRAEADREAARPIWDVPMTWRR